jgi:putative transposase
MTQFTPRKSSPRLDGFVYRGHYAYFVTSNTAERHRLMVGDFGEECVSLLTDVAGDRAFEVLAYTFMPDHVHLLVQGAAPGADLIRFMQAFKQKTGYRFKQATGHSLWQRSYYDRILRKDEDMHDIAAYIWHNPVRSGLAPEATAYRFNGPAERVGAVSSDRAEALSLRLGSLFQESAAVV